MPLLSRLAHPRAFFLLIYAAALLLTIAGRPVLGADDDDFPGLRELMTEEEFREMGLERLSPEELEALDAWLLRYTAGEAQVLMQQKREVIREAEKDFEIVSRVRGDFRGWSGDTLFQLENGQVWRQRLAGRYAYNGPPNPEVRIEKNFFGFYTLTVIETGRGIGVSLLQ
jgi:hypothetical protein